jgi:hypothetical protein
MRIYTFYADPGHAWLKVPLAELDELEIAGDITQFSYVRGSYVYLEEDCDVTTFVQAYERKHGRRPVMQGKHGNRSSRIRTYDRYRAPIKEEVLRG